MDMRRIDIALLALLAAARQQDHQRRPVLPEINAVAGAEIDPIFEYPSPTDLTLEKFPLLQSDDGARDLRSGDRFQIGKPLVERLSTTRSDVVADFGH